MTQIHQEEQQDWLQLASVQVGATISIPMLLVGYQLASMQGFIGSIWSILLGNLALCALALVASAMSVAHRVPTVQQARRYLGQGGEKIFGVIMTLSTAGWFGLQAQCVGEDILQGLMEWIPLAASWRFALNGLVGMTMCFGVLGGLKGIACAAKVCIPLTLVTIGYALYAAEKVTIASSVLERAGSWSGPAISLVIAASIAFTIDLPTFFRYSNSYKSAAIASIVTFLVATPLMQGAGALLYHLLPQENMLSSLWMLPSPVWRIWMTCVIFIAGWTCNNANLYSACVSLTSVFPKASPKQALAMVGVLGVFFSCWDMIAYLEPLLDVAGIFVASTGGVILTAFAMDYRSAPIAIVPLSMGIMAGAASITGIVSFTNAPVLDALIVSSMTTWLCGLLMNQKNEVEA